MQKIEELESSNARLVQSRGMTVKNKIYHLITKDGMNSIEALASELNINAKNISSSLTKIRAELKPSGKTIVTQRINKKSMLAIVSLEDLGWA
mgnify:CR=1 FL=1